MTISKRFLRLLHHFVIQTTNGRKNLEYINVNDHEILHFVQNDKKNIKTRNYEFRL